MPARFLSPAPPQRTPPVSARQAPVPRAARAWAAGGAQRRASRLEVPAPQDSTVEEEEEKEEELVKLKKRPKTE